MVVGHPEERRVGDVTHRYSHVRQWGKHVDPPAHSVVDNVSASYL
jgi:hypothetical protein